MTKIAVTYKNGEIFQHFGHTEDFKVYSIEDNCISDSAVINTNGQGHEALAVFLSSLGVTVLICGGIGSGAMEALSEKGTATLRLRIILLANLNILLFQTAAIITNTVMKKKIRPFLWKTHFLSL